MFLSNDFITYQVLAASIGQIYVKVDTFIMMTSSNENIFRVTGP